MKTRALGSSHRFDMPKVIGVIMTYNCAQLLTGAVKALPLGVFDELIVVDDASRDRVADVAQELGLPFFSHPHTGYGGNVKFGLQKAIEHGAEAIVEIHGDGQFDAAAAAPGIAKMKEGYDLVLGSRFLVPGQARKDHMPWSRYFANIGLSSLARLVTGSSLSEFHNGFRIYSRSMVDKIDLTHTSNDYLFGFEIIALAIFHKLKIGEVPVRCYYAQEHTTISLPKAAKYAFQMTWVLVLYAAAKFGLPTPLFRR